MNVFPSKKCAQFYLGLNNDYILDWVKRRSIIGGIENSKPDETFIQDLDLILERKNVLIPVSFNLTMININSKKNKNTPDIC